MPASLRTYCPPPLIVIVLLSTFVAAFSAYRWILQRDSELAEQELHSQAQPLGEVLAAGVHANDPHLVERELALHSHRGEEIFLADDYGVVLIATQAVHIGHSIAEVLDGLIRSHLVTTSQRAASGLSAMARAAGDQLIEGPWTIEDNRQAQLLVLHRVDLPPVDGGTVDRTGLLLLMRDLTQHQAEMLQRVLLQGYLAIILLTLLAGSYYIVSGRKRLTRIQHLLDAAGRVAAGDLAVRIRAEGRGELEGVCRAFDQMTAKLQRARQELHANETRLAGILNTVASAIISVDHLHRIVLFNRRAEQIFGYAAPEVLGKPLLLLMPERFRRDHAAALRRFAASDQEQRPAMQRSDIRGLRKNGEEFPIEASVSSALIHGQQIFTVALDDVTERRRAEQALQQIAAGVSSHMGEDFFRELVRNMATVFEAEYAFIARVSDGSAHQVSTLAFWDNGNYGENFSYDLAGTPCATVVGKQTRTYVANVPNQFPGDLRLIKMRVSAYMGTPLCSTEGELLGLLAVLSRKPFQQPERLETALKIFAARTSAELQRQIVEAELRRLAGSLEQQVAERTAHLVAVNRELEAFCHAASHDLRDPLRAIDGFSQALLEDHVGQLDASGRDYLERVRRATKRMDRLLTELLGLSRVTRREVHRRPVDLSALAKASIAKVQQRNPSRSVNFKVAPHMMAHGDRRLLKIVLEHLFDNAWKYTADVQQALVEFGSRVEDGLLVYYVRDNGVGFEQKDAEHLFRPFQRLHPSEQYPGAGIGLATVARIIYRHGGTVWAEGEAGIGATISFTLHTAITTGQLAALRAKVAAA